MLTLKTYTLPSGFYVDIMDDNVFKYTIGLNLTLVDERTIKVCAAFVRELNFGLRVAQERNA